MRLLHSIAIATTRVCTGLAGTHRVSCYLPVPALSASTATSPRPASTLLFRGYTHAHMHGACTARRIRQLAQTSYMEKLVATHSPAGAGLPSHHRVKTTARQDTHPHDEW